MNRSTLAGLFTDAVILIGLAMLFYGLYIQWPWLAFTVVGAIVTLLGVLMLR